MAKQQTSADPLKLVLSTHRMSYVHLDKPHAFKDEKGDEGKPKYSTTFLIPKNHPDVAKIQAVLKQAYETNKGTLFPGLPFTSPKLWNPLRDGDEYADEKIGEGAKEEQVAAYRGCYHLKATSGGDKPAPIVFEQLDNGTRVEVIDVAGEVYSGCYGRGVLKCNAYNNIQKGFGFYINSICKTKDGERLGGFTADEADYELDNDATDYSGEEIQYNTAPAARPTPTPRAAAPAARPARIYDVDAENNSIYSDDNGANWFYAE